MNLCIIIKNNDNDNDDKNDVQIKIIKKQLKNRVDVSDHY